MADVKNTVVKNGDALAQQNGAANAQEYINDLNTRMASKDIAVADAGLDAATNFVQKLTKLTLYQEIDGEYLFDAYKYVNKFETSKIAAGNSKQYQRKILTGHETYDATKFVPDKISAPVGEVATISLYKDANGSDGNEVLTDYGYKFKKGVSIQPQKWLPYFTSGKLQEFITDAYETVNQSFYLFKVAMIEKMITDMKPTRTAASGGNYTLSAQKIQKNIVGTASNLLTAFTQEIFPEIEKMRFLSSDYNINLNGTATSLNSTNGDKLILLMNTNTATKLTHGVIANVFNAQLVKPDAFIRAENIFRVNKMLSVPGTDNNAPITITTTNLLEEDEIIVLTEDAIKHLYWIYKPEKQGFAENITTQFTLHAWGAFGFIPWGMGFYYTNKNMANLPTA